MARTEKEATAQTIMDGDFPARRNPPKTKIASLFIGFNVMAAMLVAVTAVLGLIVPMKGVPLYWHISFGLGTVILGMFGLSAAMFYLIATGVAIRETAAANGLPKDIYSRTHRFKKELFPRCVTALVLLIAMVILGAAVHFDKLPKYVHLVFALITSATYLEAVRNMRKNFYLNCAVMADARGPEDAPRTVAD